MIKRPRTEKDQLARNELAADVRKLNWYGDKWKELAELLLKVGKPYEESLNSEYCIKIRGELIDAINNNPNEVESIISESLFDHVLTNDIAEILIDRWYLDILKKNLDKFVDLSDEVYETLINSWVSVEILQNLISFKNPNNIIKNMNDKGLLKGAYITRDISLCYWLNLNKESLRILMPLSDGKRWLYTKMSSFKWLDKESLFELLESTPWYNFTDFGWTYDFNNSLKYFRGLDKEVALKLFKMFWNEWRSMVAYNLESFEWLDLDIAKQLIAVGYRSKVAEHPEKFWLKKEK